MRAAWGFLVGLSAGAVTSLIFAPKSGKETQEFIVRKVRNGLNQAAFATSGVRAATAVLFSPLLTLMVLICMKSAKAEVCRR